MKHCLKRERNKLYVQLSLGQVERSISCKAEWDNGDGGRQRRPYHLWLESKSRDSALIGHALGLAYSHVTCPLICIKTELHQAPAWAWKTVRLSSNLNEEWEKCWTVSPRRCASMSRMDAPMISEISLAILTVYQLHHKHGFGTPWLWSAFSTLFELHFHHVRAVLLQ